jgi:hypothetical protein
MRNKVSNEKDEFIPTLVESKKQRYRPIPEISIYVNRTFKFPGFPVLHVIDKAWGSASGVDFNKSETCVTTLGLVQYLRDAVGQRYLNAFTGDAIE